MMNRSLIFIITTLFLAVELQAQEYTFQTFKDTRIINSHSIETVRARKLDVRIGHRFGNINSGWQQLYGLESAADVLFGVEYGASDELTFGFSRTKGAGLLTALLSGTVKYRILRQTTDGATPVSLTVVGVSTVSTMTKSNNELDLNNFKKFSHRMSHTVQALVGRKFSDGFSLQISPGYTHRNQVPFGDENGIFSVGLASRIQISKVFGIIADFTYPFSSFRNDSANGFYPPFGIGLEIDTGGHIFQVNFTNATGIIENDYIPYTQSNWFDGEFRLGFTISRIFNL